MILPDAALFVGVASVMAALGIALFKMSSDKKKSMDADIDKTYTAMNKHLLQPALQSIIGSRRGVYKTQELFKTPDVIKKLDAYKRALFEYNEASSRRGAILAWLGLACKASFFTAGTLYLVTAVSTADSYLTRFLNSPHAVMSYSWSIVGFGMVTVAYALYKCHAEESAFCHEMRAIRSWLQ